MEFCLLKMFSAIVFSILCLFGSNSVAASNLPEGYYVLTDEALSSRSLVVEPRNDWPETRPSWSSEECWDEYLASKLQAMLDYVECIIQCGSFPTAPQINACKLGCENAYNFVMDAYLAELYDCNNVTPPG